VSKEYFSFKDTYGIDIVEGEDDITILATAVAIDLVNQSEGSSIPLHRPKGVNWYIAEILSQFLSQAETASGYCFPHLSSSVSKAVKAASSEDGFTS